MTRSLLVALALGAAVLSSSSSAVLARQNQPGLPTLAKVHILNREVDEAVPVKLFQSTEVVPVVVMTQPPVALAPATIVGIRTARQTWEYRRVVVPAADDATVSLNAAGLDGWEAVSSSPSGGNVIWTLKRPR